MPAYVAFAYDRDDQAKPTATGGHQIMIRNSDLAVVRHWAAARFTDTDRYVTRVRVFHAPDIERGDFHRDLALEVIERPAP
ncbi:hypothetical protein [Actinocrinis sp.]|uniref:hypothetical protein n=1 Tax=Actinocrinis sp. TaxID=1920516 RepID=UPI002D730729|nr:hypothetical protein [Actinocrinis sp.]HZP54619.1 hypothetical protein [Actinocrinis sp.]